MRKLFNLLPICLTLFDGAAAGAAAGGAVGGAGAAAQAGTQQASPQSGHGGRKAASTETVVYGKQTGDNGSSAAGSNQQTTGQPASAAGSAVTTDAAEAKKAAFEELISGEYKDLFTERTQKIINQRFKETMDNWSVVVVIVTLVGLGAAIVKPIVSLTKSITTLTVVMGNLKDEMQCLTEKNRESHERIWNHEEQQDKQLGDHEKRIYALEERE